MKASELLASRGRSVAVHPVTVRLLDPNDSSRVAEVGAVLRFVPDRLRIAADDRAAESLAKLKTPPTAERVAAERAYHLLVEAVRQENAPAMPLFDSVIEAQSMLVDDEAMRVRNEYERYKAAQFPETLSQEDAKKLAEDARNFTLADLLRSCGFWQIHRALPFLAVTFGASLTPMSSPIGSAST